METNSRENIFITWFLWQFYEMPKFLLQVWNNYFTFAANFFSVGLLFKTFFAPWRRYKWRYPKAFDLKEFFNTLISNTVSRILGAMMRIVLIIFGFFLQVFVVTLGLIVFIVWLLAPFAIIAGLTFAIFF